MARPLGFEPDVARAALMSLFWDKGYEGASMQDVEAATGLKKQSLYRLFGDKRHMYLAALACYEDQVMAAAEALLSTPGSARDRVARLFRLTADEALASGDRRGCFLCNAAVDQAPHDPETATRVADMVTRLTAMFDGALAADAGYATDKTLRGKRATQLVAAYFGLRVLIKAGGERAALDAAIEGAIALI